MNDKILFALRRNYPVSYTHLDVYKRQGFTLDTYAHVTSAAQRQAAQTMGNVLSCSLRASLK